MDYGYDKFTDLKTHNYNMASSLVCFTAYSILCVSITGVISCFKHKVQTTQRLDVVMGGESSRNEQDHINTELSSLYNAYDSQVWNIKKTLITLNNYIWIFNYMWANKLTYLNCCHCENNYTGFQITRCAKEDPLYLNKLTHPADPK